MHLLTQTLFMQISPSVLAGSDFPVSRSTILISMVGRSCPAIARILKWLQSLVFSIHLM